MDNLVTETKKLNMPRSTRQDSRRSREQGRAFTNFLFAFLLSIIFMYLILARSSRAGFTRDDPAGPAADVPSPSSRSWC